MKYCNNATLRTCSMKNGKSSYHLALCSGYRDTIMMKAIRSRRHEVMVYKPYTLFNKKPVKGYYLIHYRQLVRNKEKKWLYIAV